MLGEVVFFRGEESIEFGFSQFGVTLLGEFLLSDFDPVIFGFIRELRVDELEELNLELAEQMAFEVFLLQHDPPDYTLTVNHAPNKKENLQFKPAEGAIFVKVSKAFQGEN